MREVPCDMSPASIKGVRKNLPNAAVNFDKLHVIKVLGEAMEKFRRSGWRKDKTVKGGRWGLPKNPDNLMAKQRGQLHDITTCNAALAEVYRLKGTFRDFFRQPELKSATGLLKSWIAVAEQSEIKPMIKAAKTLRYREKDILRWFFHHLTNAVMEGLHSLLQSAKRKARGYRLHKIFITMAYVIAGRLDFAIPRCAAVTH